MILAWQELFRAPVSHEPLVWADDSMLSAAGQVIGHVQSGVPDFIGRQWHDMMEADKLPDWVSQGWDRKRASLADPMFRMLCERAVEGGPMKIDIATGPAGGLVPAILEMDPSASVMGSDIEIRTMVEWARFMHSRSIEPNVLFACFDACNMPIADECIDVVCSDDGFTNIPYQDTALAEALRVLRPGGLLVVREEQASPGSREAVLKTMGAQVTAMLPGVMRGWAELIGATGFNLEERQMGRTRYLDPGESGVAAKAARVGIQIEVESHFIIARK